ncbi:outer membrane protein assembly factor BamA [Terrihabitans soli]|uniref:Outer membrane protein assembly factor BamA n=1 Tax=Terrihabitans soli TaxID=708113 RepID=A0A6S6QHU4_9HYPH|nr:outer membrane protein assembly factor BamA [Terrihabitans soli]BCJ90773.1 outer membrane protein assembly factor BamA [Terrihabitans soli]
MTFVYRAFVRLTAAYLFVAGLALLGGLVAVSPALAQANITVRGNSRVEADAIRAHFSTAPGERLDNVKIDEAVKSLYATGLFEDVRVARTGGGLTVTVVENAVLNRVYFEGNQKIKDATLAAEVQSKSRGPYSQTAIQSDTTRILELYRRAGRYNATVEPQVISRPNGRVDLVFKINEDSKSKISEIEFVGNEAFSDGRLRDEMTTTESNFMSWLKTSDVYDTDRVNADLELVRRFYLSKGYADFRIVSSEVNYSNESNAFVIKVTVEEGPIYKFADVGVESTVADVDPKVLEGLIKGGKGDVYSATDVEKTVEQMSIELATQGYAFAQVRPRGSRDYENHTVSVTYSVEEGARVYVERINVRGNTRTRDYVIRREFDLAEGDAYNQALINRAERRLNRLGFFKAVRITSEPGSSPDRLIVNVDVEDQPTGEFSVSGGYSSADGLIAEFSVAEKNLFGRGYYVKIGTTQGERTSGYDLSFTDPYFLGRRISAGFDLYQKERKNSDYNAYDLDTVGGALRLGFPITDPLTFGVNYQIYNRDISIDSGLTDGCSESPCADPSDDPEEASIALQEAEGDTLTSLAGYSFVYNSLDSVQNPKNGIRAEFRQDFAGLGGDAEFVRTTFDGRYYHELPADLVGFVRLQAGHIVGWGDGDLTILDHFNKGPDLVRGFEPSGIGPRDRDTGDSLGGTYYIGGTAEVQFPLPVIPKELGLKGAVFADVGTLAGYEGCDPCTVSSGTFDIDVDPADDIRSSVGVSLLWQSPMGPLRFDYAWAITKADADEEQNFRFSGGGRF